MINVVDKADDSLLVVRLWNRLPVVVRAVIVGELLVTIGGLPELLLFVNLKFLPAIPWSLATSALWLWLFWRYVNGWGWPRSTSQQRRRDVRANKLSWRVWRWSLLAGAMGMVSVIALSFLTPRFTDIPRDAFKLPVDFTQYPPWTVLSILLAISAFAGVLEEVAFRGYMLSPIQRRHGWPVAILVTGTVFFLDHHFSHAYATFAFLPFFLAVSTLHGILVYTTLSILPSIVLHTVADFIVIPIQYGIIGSPPVSNVLNTGVDSSFFLCLGLFLGFGIACVPVFRHLARVARAELTTATPEQ
ncbi:MAG TPA: type II CAAX endopeptidase family protein [Acidobacteriota bacterium]|nr:type II CAAX endopeptidase family protein [Acidobacteriota bacterium]